MFGEMVIKAKGSLLFFLKFHPNVHIPFVVQKLEPEPCPFRLLFPFCLRQFTTEGHAEEEDKDVSPLCPSLPATICF